MSFDRGPYTSYDVGREAVESFISGLIAGRTTLPVTTTGPRLYVATCATGSRIALSFPPSRSGSDLWNFSVELIVDGRPLPLSHFGLSLDILTKIRRGSHSPTAIREALRELSIGAVPDGTPYRRESPCSDVLRLVRSSDRITLRQAEPSILTLDLDIQELFWSMFFLLLRDEINTPLPDYQGRQFALDRYAEMVHSASNEEWRVESVLSRILSGPVRVPRWNCCDYSYVSPSVASSPPHATRGIPVHSMPYVELPPYQID